MRWNPLENGEKAHNFFGHFINSKWCQQLIVSVLETLPYNQMVHMGNCRS
jgi:hypothetical protein